jgi:hypothetical protein
MFGMELVITEAKTKTDIKKFVRFVGNLYRGNAFFVHAIEADERKLFSKKCSSGNNADFKCFLAIRDGRVVGRLAVIIQHQYNEKYNCKHARFTRFDFIDDVSVARALMEEGVKYALEQGMDTIHGPLGFHDMDQEGVLVEGFDSLVTIVNPYNYAYYKPIIEELEFEKEIDWLEYRVPVPKELSEKEIKIQQRMTERLKLTLLPDMSMRKLINLYGQQVFDVIDSCYAPNHGTVPITGQVRDSILKQFKLLIRKDQVSVAFNEKGDVIGFALAMPNISRSVQRCKGRMLPFGWLHILREARNPKYIDMGLIAVVDEYKGKGVNVIVANEVWKYCIRKKILSTESNLELETNIDMLGQSASWNKEFLRRRRCYIKKIQNPDTVTEPLSQA